MRFVLEHPWASGFIVASLAFVLIWTGLRDGNSLRFKSGIVVTALAVVAVLLGTMIDTPREQARSVVLAFIEAVENNDIYTVRQLVSPFVLVVDDFDGRLGGTVDGVVQGVKELHREYPPTSNTILRLEVFERDKDVLVALSMMTRVTHIGSVPNGWRIFVAPDDTGTWQINTIDAVEIAFRSYR